MNIEGLVATTSMVKRDSENELILQEACRKATEDGRPFSVKSVYDQVVGSCTEFTIWHKQILEVKQ